MTGRNYLRIFIACALAFALSHPSLARDSAPPQQAGNQAIWKIDGAKGRVYLFGSVHLLPPGVDWHTPALDAALNEAETITFELDLDDAHDTAKMQKIIQKLGVLPQGETLRKLLAPEQRAKYERVLASLGLPAPNLDPLRPWLAAVTVGVQWIVSKGYDPNSGVDEKIWNWGKDHKKQLGALETTEDQLGAFAGLTRDQEVEFLIISLDQIDDQPTMLDDLVAAWRKGDTAQLDKLLNADMDDFPILRDRLLKGRNAKWIPKIEALRANGRTHLVVVGTAHLVGKDSVIAMLRAKGIKVEGP